MAATAAADGRRPPSPVSSHGTVTTSWCTACMPLPQLAGLPGVVAASRRFSLPFSDRARCGSCSEPIDASNFLVNEVPPKQLAADDQAAVRAAARRVAAQRGAGIPHPGDRERRAHRLGDPGAHVPRHSAGAVARTELAGTSGWWASPWLKASSRRRTHPALRPFCHDGVRRCGDDTRRRPVVACPTYVCETDAADVAGFCWPTQLAATCSAPMTWTPPPPRCRARSGLRSSAGTCWQPWPRSQRWQ